VLAGRTDAGVHARGQRANFHTASNLALATFVRGLNALLPGDVAVQRAQEVPEKFHARFDALLRVYCYTLHNETIRSPLARKYAWHVPGPLDCEAMEAGLALLVGKHDFASYAGASAGQAQRPRVTVRTMRAARCWVEAPWVRIEVAADSFLRHMVRNLVGELVRLGQRTLSLAEFRANWEARDRGRAGPPAPPEGLVLVRVEYAGGI
jgi:tRNA pseudouridine38-40 synthase